MSIVTKDAYPIGLTAQQIGMVLSQGTGHPWSESAAKLVHTLTTTAPGNNRAYLDNRNTAVGKTRVFKEDQVLIALVHLLLRQIGKVYPPFYEQASLSMFDGGKYMLEDPYKDDPHIPKKERMSPAQRVINLWRHGHRGFSFELYLCFEETNFGSEFSTEAQCGLALTEFGLPFKPKPNNITKISLSLDQHLARLFGDGVQ